VNGIVSCFENFSENEYQPRKSFLSPREGTLSSFDPFAKKTALRNKENTKEDRETGHLMKSPVQSTLVATEARKLH
jgi:hypothetical protein